MTESDGGRRGGVVKPAPDAPSQAGAASLARAPTAASASVSSGLPKSDSGGTSSKAPPCSSSARVLCGRRELYGHGRSQRADAGQASAGLPAAGAAARGVAAGVRRRLLPAWMGAAGEQRATVASRKSGRWRQRQRQREAAGPRAATAVVYCMNEAELLDVALSVLAEHLQCEEGDEKAPHGSEEEQECQPTASEAPGSAGEGSKCSPVALCPPDAGADTEGTVEDAEDDVLKYVREIFFS
ncbi:cell cycle regulator of non-homologous end joining [Melanerpes formicivorus]|uniref:cell cycle regulator of non-homologous end joining n=1 Tax=Melanerpes formicivorus TaxID=211600 RepID=UPI00358F9863